MFKRHKTMTLDLTTGQPIKLMFRFATPMLISGIFQALYAMVDSAVLGRFVGADALAAIGAASSTVNFILMLVMAFTGAISVILSQAVGSGDQKKITACIVNTVWLCGICGFTVGLLSLFLARPLMVLLDAPADIIDQSVLYIRLIGGFCIVQFAYNAASSILRAIGDSRTPLVFLVLCSLLNIAFDLFAVLILHMGIGGVAVATIIAQAISASACLIFMFRKHENLRIPRGGGRPIWSLLREIVGMGLQMCLQNALLSVGMMVITQTINSFGSNIVAAFTVGSNVQNLVTTALYSYVMAFSVFAGQNFGARAYTHLSKGFREMALLTTVFCTLATAISLLFPAALVSLYVHAEEAEVIAAAIEFVRIQSYFYIFLGLIELYNATVRGIGKISVVTLASFIELGAKVLGSILLSRLFGYIGIWYAAPIGWILGIFPAAIYFHSGRWRNAPPPVPPENTPLEMENIIS